MAAWAQSLGVTRQAAYAAVQRCSIPVVDGLVDAEAATMLYRLRTRARVKTEARPRVARRRDDDATSPTGLAQQAREISLVALEALRAGRFASIEADLRAALRAVPMRQREGVALAVEVWDALTDAVASRLARDDDQVGDSQRVEPDELGESGELGEFWFAVAAGEVIEGPQ